MAKYTVNMAANGFKVTNPEGYVAVDKKGKAVKLVDRMEFRSLLYESQI